MARRWFWPPYFLPKNSLRSSALYSGNPIISKEISGKSEGPSAEAIKTIATVAQRWRDGGATVAAAVARQWFWPPEISADLLCPKPGYLNLKNVSFIVPLEYVI